MERKVTVPDLQHEHLPEMFTPTELAPAGLVATMVGRELPPAASRGVRTLSEGDGPPLV